MPISTFNPFSLTKSAEYSRTGIQIQEVVFYAESRFRAILTYINNDLNKSEIDRKYWVQTLLHRELVSISCNIVVMSTQFPYRNIFYLLSAYLRHWVSPLSSLSSCVHWPAQPALLRSTRNKSSPCYRTQASSPRWILANARLSLDSNSYGG